MKQVNCLSATCKCRIFYLFSSFILLLFSGLQGGFPIAQKPSDDDRKGALCPLSPSIGYSCPHLTAFDGSPWPQPSSENCKVTKD